MCDIHARQGRAVKASFAVFGAPSGRVSDVADGADVKQCRTLIVDGRAMIARSLTQTRDVLEFKCTKTEKPRPVKLPESAIVALEAHRQQQDEFRRQFGPDYRAVAQCCMGMRKRLLTCWRES